MKSCGTFLKMREQTGWAGMESTLRRRVYSDKISRTWCSGQIRMAPIPTKKLILNGTKLITNIEKQRLKT